MISPNTRSWSRKHPDMNDCQCTGPGWCERHGVRKSKHWVHLCQTNNGYWRAWEEGRGPGQLKSSGKSTSSTSVSVGPGSILSKLLGCGGLQSTYRHSMDSWGVEQCTQKMDIIIEWLVDQGCCRQPLDRLTAERLVRIAIERANEI